MSTFDNLIEPGDCLYIAACEKRERAAKLLHDANDLEQRAIALWASLEPMETPPCSSTDSSASSSA